MVVSGQLDTKAVLLPGERALSSRWIEGWLSPRVGLERNLNSSARTLVDIPTELARLQGTR
jgi:hypothetical protein